jgi:hypothetical protein
LITVRALAVIGLTLTAIFVAPVASHACERSSEGERYEAEGEGTIRGEIGGAREFHSRIVLCDGRTGRERILRRGTMQTQSGRGLALHGGSAAGGRVVWVEVRGDGRSTRVDLVESRARDGEALRRTRLSSGRAQPYVETARLGAVVRSDFGVVTTVPSDPEPRLVLLRGGKRLREVADDFASNLALEDGRTVRYLDAASRRHYVDLAPVPRGPFGCPVRARWERVIGDERVHVTDATYGSPDASTGFASVTVVRACLRSTGQDPVVVQTRSSTGDSQSARTLLTAGDWAVVPVLISSRGEACVATRYAPMNLRTGQRAPVSTVNPCDAAAVLTDRGALATVQLENGVAILRVRSVVGVLTELDRAAAGAITDLRAEGKTLRWENAGQPRSAEVR